MGEVDGLYLNDGRGRFRAVEWTGGAFLDENGERLAEPPRDWGLSAMFRDLNEDGRPDLYVCNDFFTPDRIWINQGGGVSRVAQAGDAQDALRLHGGGRRGFGSGRARRDFRDGDAESGSSPAAGAAQSAGDAAVAEVGMGMVLLGDAGTRVQVMRNTLAWNRGDGTYAEVAAYAGVSASEWTWGLAFADVDLDGFEDSPIANGHGRDVANSDALAEVDARPKGVNPMERSKTHGLFPPPRRCRISPSATGAILPSRKWGTRGGSTWRARRTAWRWPTWTTTATSMSC